MRRVFTTPTDAARAEAMRDELAGLAASKTAAGLLEKLTGAGGNELPERSA